MKPVIAAFGVALLIAPVVASAAVYSWDGAQNSDWKRLLGNNNWDTAGYPGQNQAGDTATIAEDNNANPSNPAFLSGSLNFSVAGLTLDASNANVGDDLHFRIQSGGNLVVSNTTTIMADTNTTDKYNATIQLQSGGAFDPAALRIYGGSATAGLAQFDFDAGTLTNPDSLTMRGLSKVDSEQDIAGVGNLVVDADSGSPIVAQAEIDMLTGKTMTASSVAIDAEYAACKLDKTGAGTLTVSGALEVYSGLDSGENAEFQFTTGSLTFSSMTLDGFNSSAKAILDLDQDVTQGSSDVAVADYADIQVASGKTFTVDDLVVGDNDNAGADYNGILAVSGGGTISAQRIIIRGESGGGSTVTASSSSIVTR